jgi:DNA-binding response OmpR family regulator
VPIIFLSVVSDTKRKIEALRKGADDYLTKPFFFDELKERVKALLRRPQKIIDPLLTVGDLTLDMEKRVVERGGEPIYLTRKEYSLLEYLMRNANMAISRSMILEHVWNADSDPLSNTVEAHIMRLRKKLNTGHTNELIKNIPGRGYVIDL